MSNNLVKPPVRTRATPNITPFTYYDGLTYLEILEQLRKWLREVFVPEFNDLAEYVDEEIAGALATVEDTLNAKIVEIDQMLADQNEHVDQEIADLTTYVDDAVQQIINSSIVVQDAVIKGALEDTNTATGFYFDRNTIKTSVVRTYGELVSACASPAPVNIYIPSEETIEVDETVYPNENVKSITLDGEIVVTSDVVALEWASDPILDEYPITSALAEGTRSVVSPEAVGIISVGDWINVKSDATSDIDGHRQHWLRKVRQVAGDTFTLDKPLPVNMNAGNRRLSPVNMLGGAGFTGSGTVRQSSMDFTSAMLMFRRIDGLTVSGVTVRDGGGSGIGVAMCNNFEIDATIDNLRDEITTGHHGYGVSLMSAARNGRVGGTISKCRHAVTTNASGDPEDIIVEPITYGCTNKALDTHANGWGITFRANDSGSAGVIHVRANNVRVDSVISDGCNGAPVVTVHSAVTVPPTIGKISATNINHTTILGANSRAYVDSFPTYGSVNDGVFSGANNTTALVTPRGYANLLTTAVVGTDVNGSIIEALAMPLEAFSDNMFEYFIIYESTAASPARFRFYTSENVTMRYSVVSTGPSDNLRIQYGGNDTNSAFYGTGTNVARISGNIRSRRNVATTVFPYIGSGGPDSARISIGSTVNVSRYK